MPYQRSRLADPDMLAVLRSAPRNYSVSMPQAQPLIAPSNVSMYTPRDESMSQVQTEELPSSLAERYRNMGVERSTETGLTYNPLDRPVDEIQARSDAQMPGARMIETGRSALEDEIRKWMAEKQEPQSPIPQAPVYQSNMDQGLTRSASGLFNPVSIGQAAPVQMPMQWGSRPLPNSTLEQNAMNMLRQNPELIDEYMAKTGGWFDPGRFV